MKSGLEDNAHKSKNCTDNVNQVRKTLRLLQQGRKAGTKFDFNCTEAVVGF